MIETNLNSTISTVQTSMARLSSRGMAIDYISKQSEDLLNSSDEFVAKFIPWYKRVWKNIWICPNWWWEFKQEDEEEYERKKWVEI